MNSEQNIHGFGSREGLFESFLESALNPICIFRKDGTFEFFNRSFNERFGNPSSAKEWMKEFITDPDEHERFSELYARAVYCSAEGFTAKSDFIIQDKEGRSAYTEITYHCNLEHFLFSFNELETRKKRLLGILQDMKFTQTILERMDDGVVACDENGKLVLFNRMAREWHGLDPEEIGAEEWSSRYGLYEEDGITLLDKDHIPLTRAFEGEILKDVPFSVRVEDKPIRYFLASGGPVYDNTGKKTGALIVMKDITEQRRNLNELKEREQEYRNLLETIPDVLLETDMSGKIVFINDVLVLKNYISCKEELLGHNIFEFVKEEDRALAFQNFSRFTERNPGTMEYRIAFANNRIVYCDVKGNLLYDIKGNPRGIVFILRDLTSHRQRENEIRMLAHTIRSVSECVSITDTSDKIIFVNDAFLRTYGYIEAELIGNNMKIVRSKHNNPAVVSKILPETLSGGWEGEIMNRRKDGHEFPILLSTSVVRDEKGEVICLVGICKDITLQKKAEQELNESRQRFQNYFENTTVGICVTSPEKGWIAVNNHICQLLGYSKEELSTLTWEKLTHPDDLNADLELFEKVNQGVIDSYELDKRFIRRDGTVVFTTLYVAAARNTDGTLNHFLASMVDITSRKKAELAITASEKRFRDLTNLLPVVIYETDQRGRLVYTNKAGYDTFGYTPEDIEAGVTIFDMLREDQIPKAIERFTKIATEAANSSSEYLMKKKNGEFFHALITSTSLENDGKVTGVRGVVIDISDSKKAEELRIANEAAQAMIKAQRHLSLLVDQSLVGFIEMDINLKVTSWNPSAQRIFGYTSAEAVGKTLSDLIIHPSERSRTKKNLEEILKNKSGFKNINHNLTKDGREIICEWHDTAIVETDGQVLSVVSLVADITERIEAEEALKESQEKLKKFAAHLQQAIEEERIQISRDLHDTLGQSLTGLKMYASRLRTKVNANDIDYSKLAEGLDEMISIIDSVMQMIRRIARKLRPRVLDEVGLIPAIVSQLEEFRVQSGIRCNLSTEMESIPIFPKHKIEVFRIVQEALTNVIRHSKASMVDISLIPQGKFTSLEIHDDGIGLDAENAGKKNTLGLLGMKERAATFGGILDICGEPGKGTTLILKIPVYKDTL